jgi:hypothetical protein
MPADLPLAASVSPIRWGFSSLPLGHWRGRRWVDWCVEAAQRITDRMLVRRTNLMPWSS